MHQGLYYNRKAIPNYTLFKFVGNTPHSIRLPKVLIQVNEVNLDQVFILTSSQFISLPWPPAGSPSPLSTIYKLNEEQNTSLRSTEWSEVVPEYTHIQKSLSMLFRIAFMVCFYVDILMPQHSHGHQRTISGSHFSPSTFMWILVTKCR